MDILFTFLKAFIVGGAICTIAQLLINYTKLTAGKILVYFLLSGVVLQAVGLYQYLVDFAGAGATVPISGFLISAPDDERIIENAAVHTNCAIKFCVDDG